MSPWIYTGVDATRVDIILNWWIAFFTAIIMLRRDATQNRSTWSDKRRQQCHLAPWRGPALSDALPAAIFR